ncbi:MAG: UDP-glucose 4-epimerase GalE [Elusimicrobiales bacterium]
MILITGGAGYIGSHVNKLLAKSGMKTVVYDNLSTGHRENLKWGEFVEGDILDTARLEQALREYKVDCVMHFAAFIEVGESMSDPEKYYRNNAAGAISVLSAMRRAGVGKFVFSSTCATYGMPLKIPLTEDHPQNPINVYGRTKLMVERALADFSAAYGFRYAALRYFNASGADPELETGELHTPETHLIPNILAAADSGGAVGMFGDDYPTPDGTCIRDYIHVSDLASAHMLAAQYLDGGGASDCFNLGNGNGFSVRQVIAAAEAVTGRKISVTKKPRRPGDPPVLLGDASKAVKILGWKPQFAGLDTIVRTAWQWHKKTAKPGV